MTTTRAGWLTGLAMTLLALAGWILDMPYVLALPAATLIGWWGFARTDLYLSTVLFLVPLSVNLSEFGLTSMGWYMPTEPMLFALLVLWFGRCWLLWHRIRNCFLFDFYYHTFFKTIAARQ